MSDTSNLMKANLLDRTREPSDEDLVVIVRGLGKEAMDGYNAAMAGFHEEWVERARKNLAARNLPNGPDMEPDV